MQVFTTSELNVYSIDFDPIYPVGCGLIVWAKSKDEAMAIAKETIVHTKPKNAVLVSSNGPGVIYYDDGNY